MKTTDPYLYPLQTLFVVGYTVFTLSIRPSSPWHFDFFLISWKRTDGYSSISAHIDINKMYLHKNK